LIISKGWKIARIKDEPAAATEDIHFLLKIMLFVSFELLIYYFFKV